MRCIVVYCGSSDRILPVYLEAARATGRAIADRGLTLVYGGGGTGMMGAVADAALGAGGRVVGIIPEQFNTPTMAHAGLSELRVVDSMHTRKAQMAAEADAFIALPGGFGTLEELLEILTWAQIGLHHRPVGLLNTQGYFDLLLAFFAKAQAEGFIYSEHRDLMVSEAEPELLLDWLAAYTPPSGLERWWQRPDA
jgi:uncharacterized protein (TIGR00730 family)